MARLPYLYEDVEPVEQDAGQLRCVADVREEVHSVLRPHPICVHQLVVNEILHKKYVSISGCGT